jgi:hypothetical protein
MKIDTLEYSWVKATSVFMRLRNFSCSRLKYPTSGTPSFSRHTYKFELHYLHHSCSGSVSIDGSHLVVVARIGREKRRELGRSQAYQVLLDLVSLRVQLIFE